MAHTVAEGASESDSNLSFFWSREGEKAGGAEGANFKPKAISFFFFLSFMSWHEQTCGCTIASVTPSTMCSCAGRACLAPPHPHIPRLSDRLHLGEVKRIPWRSCWENSSLAWRLWVSPRVPNLSWGKSDPAKFAQGWVSLHCPVPANLPWATGFLLAFNSGVVKGEELQKVLMRLSDWEIKWQMKFSVYKQKVVLCGEKQPLDSL